jgi:hypothetical protein
VRGLFLLKVVSDKNAFKKQALDFLILPYPQATPQSLLLMPLSPRSVAAAAPAAVALPRTRTRHRRPLRSRYNSQHPAFLTS